MVAEKEEEEEEETASKLRYMEEVGERLGMAA